MPLTPGTEEFAAASTRRVCWTLRGRASAARAGTVTQKPERPAMTSLFVGLSMLLVLNAPPNKLQAQSPNPAAGHWEGSIQVPGQELKIEVDLQAKSAGKWEGAIAIPAQSLKGFPLSAITIGADKVSFALAGVPGNPTFTGTIGKDGKSISGEYTQGGGTMPFALTRTGEAKIEPAPKSTAITKEVQGNWEGALDVNGTALRLVLKLSAGADGLGTGTLVSLDQGGAEIPVTAVIQTGSHVKLVVQPVAGTYEGDLKDGQLSGTWTQGPGTLPLVFKRPAK
jgi:uncharacterized protein